MKFYNILETEQLKKHIEIQKIKLGQAFDPNNK